MADPTTISIDEAIETLTLMGTPEFKGHTEDIIKARKLGIEALIRRKTPEGRLKDILGIPLPGETKAESKPPRKGHPITHLPIRKGK